VRGRRSNVTHWRDQRHVGEHVDPSELLVSR